MAKLIGPDTLENFARAIAVQHKPLAFNWAGKFGLSETAPGFGHNPVAVAQATPPPLPSQVIASFHSEAIEPGTEERKPRKKLICATCAQPVELKVARFCWFNKARFGENIYCRECQQAV